MHPFCQQLKDCVADILKDGLAATAILNGLDEILATEETSVDARDVVGKVLDVVLPHPAVTGRFRQFLSTELTRGGHRGPIDPQVPLELPSLQELFDTLRLVKNTIVLARPVTDDDVATEILAQINSAQSPSDPCSGFHNGSRR